MAEEKKFLDQAGVQYLWSKISMEDYPNNQDLINVITAIDETKADKDDIVPSDWNQNDPEAPDYVQNRTHWSEYVFKTLIEEQSVTTDDDPAYAQMPGSLYLTVGETYKVVFDGTAYECVARKTSNWDSIHIGNSSIMGASGGGNGEPFCIDNFNDGKFYLNTTDAGIHTVSISVKVEEIHKIDSKYLDLNIVDGFSEGSLRTKYSAGGSDGYVMGEYAFAEGYRTQATGPASHAEGMGTEAIGNYSHAEGIWTNAENEAAHAEGYSTFAKGSCSHAEGRDATAAGNYSHVEGLGTQALSGVQHVQGRWNIPDSENKYLHIVGNGSAQYAHSNAHTLDWEGNAWFAGKVFIGGTSMEDATELGSGGSKLVSYNETNVATANQTEFIIDLISFDASVDTVEVYSGRTRLSPSLDYTINGNIVTLSEGLPEGRTLDIRILKNVVTPKEEVLIQGSQIAPGSIPLDRLAEAIQLDKVFIRHDTTGVLYRIGLDDNGLYTVAQDEDPNLPSEGGYGSGDTGSGTDQGESGGTTVNPTFNLMNPDGDTISYTYEEGMTWLEFIDSEYGSDFRTDRVSEDSPVLYYDTPIGYLKSGDYYNVYGGDLIDRESYEIILY